MNVIAGWVAIAGGVSLVVSLLVAQVLARVSRHYPPPARADKTLASVPAVRADDAVVEQLSLGVPVDEIRGADAVAREVGVLRDFCREGTDRPDPAVIAELVKAWPEGPR